MDTQSGLDAVVMQIVRQLQQFAIASERYVDVTGSRHDMHRTDLHALHIITRAEQAGEHPTASELGTRLGLTPAAVTALVDRLEDSGHARRERNDRDRRRVRVVTTEKARQDGRRMFRPLAEALASVIQQYDEQDRLLLTDFLAKVTEAVEGTLAERSRPGSH